MTKKRKGKAKQQDPDFLQQSLGGDEGSVGEEEGDGVREEGQGEEAEAEEVEQGGNLLQDKSEEAEAARAAAKERPAADAEAEATEAEVKPEAAEEPAAEEPSEAEQAALDAKKALQDEVTQLRAKNRELKQSQAMVQAPPPQVQQPATAPQVAGSDFEVKFNDDGKAILSREELAQFVRGEVAEATRVDPDQQFQQMITQERRQWVGQGEDAPARDAAATTVERATEYLNELTNHYALSTGHQPDGLGGWVDAIEQSGLGDQFRTHFPDQGADMWGFVDTFFAPAHPQDRVRKIRRYMDANVGAQVATPQVPGVAQSQAPAQLSNVVPLVSKPRSMAKKGGAAKADAGAASRLDALQEKAALDAPGMSKKEWEEYEELMVQQENQA